MQADELKRRACGVEVCTRKAAADGPRLQPVAGTAQGGSDGATRRGANRGRSDGFKCGHEDRAAERAQGAVSDDAMSSFVGRGRLWSPALDDG